MAVFVMPVGLGLALAEVRRAEVGGRPPARRIYDLRHTFATFALRSGISTFDLSRYMGASLTMIDRHYGHLARDGREHAIQVLDALSAAEFEPWTLVVPGFAVGVATIGCFDLRVCGPARKETSPTSSYRPSG